MSSQRGSGLTRSRPQKHKNTFAFKNDLHDKTPQMIKMNKLNVCEVCERCKAQIEWKIRYKKYKPLSQAKTCIKCNQRTVKKAYHVACKDCAKKEKICAKCLKSADEVVIEPPQPTPSEQQHLQTEMDRLVKALPERKRRTFLRYMKKGKEVPEDGDDNDAKERKNDEQNDDDEVVKKPQRIPHSRADLLSKIEMLKIDAGGDEDDYGLDLSDSEYDEDDGDFDEDDCSD